MAIKSEFCISWRQVQGALEPSGCRTNPGRLVSDADATLAVGQDTGDTIKHASSDWEARGSIKYGGRLLRGVEKGTETHPLPHAPRVPPQPHPSSSGLW